MKKNLFVLFMMTALLLEAADKKVISALPYLQNPFGNGITVMWQTNVPAYCWVEYGEAVEGCPGEIAGTPKVARHLLDGQVVCNTTVHKVRIENLSPDKVYAYRICAREIVEYKAYKKVFGAADSTCFYSFRLPGKESRDFTAVIFNDLHKNEQTFRALCDMLGDMKYDFVIFNGDCVDDPAGKEEATRFINILHEGVGAMNKPVFYIRGNHEIRNAYSVGLRELLDYINGKTYGAFSWGDTRFVILDCGEDKPDDHWVYYGLNDFTALREEQRVFLENEMAGKTFRKADKRVLIHHIPVYGNTDAYQPCSAVWGEILAKAPFSLAVNAHTHIYSRHAKGALGNNFPVYIGGGPRMDKATVMVLDKKEDVLTIRVLDTAGKVLYREIL